MKFSLIGNFLSCDEKQHRLVSFEDSCLLFKLTFHLINNILNICLGTSFRKIFYIFKNQKYYFPGASDCTQNPRGVFQYNYNSFLV